MSGAAWLAILSVELALVSAERIGSCVSAMLKRIHACRRRAIASYARNVGSMDREKLVVGEVKRETSLLASKARVATRQKSFLSRLLPKQGSMMKMRVATMYQSILAIPPLMSISLLVMAAAGSSLMKDGPNLLKAM